MGTATSNFVIGATTLTVIAVAFVGFLGFRKIHAVQQRGPLRDRVRRLRQPAWSKAAA